MTVGDHQSPIDINLFVSTRFSLLTVIQSVGGGATTVADEHLMSEAVPLVLDVDFFFASFRK